MLAAGRHRAGPLQALVASLESTVNHLHGSSVREATPKFPQPLLYQAPSSTTQPSISLRWDFEGVATLDSPLKRVAGQRGFWGRALPSFSEQKPLGDLGPYPPIEFTTNDKATSSGSLGGSDRSRIHADISGQLPYAEALWEHISGLGKVPEPIAARGNVAVGNGAPQSSSFAQELWRHIAGLGRETPPPPVEVSVDDLLKPLHRKARGAAGLSRKQRGYPKRMTPTLQIFLQDGTNIFDGTGGSGGGTFHYSGDGGGDMGSSGALVVTQPRPESVKKVLVVPMPRKPLMPGQMMPVHIQNPKLMQLIQKQREQGILYVGAFLRRDALNSQADPNRWKDVDKLPEVFDHGTLAQIHWALPTQENSIMLLFGHRRLRMTGPVEGERFSAYVEHVQDQPYEKTDVVKATQHEVMQTVKDLMALNPLYREAASILYNQQPPQTPPSKVGKMVSVLGTLLERKARRRKESAGAPRGRRRGAGEERPHALAGGDQGRGFEPQGDLQNPSQLADFAAANTSSEAESIQAVLEELDVPKRLEMALLMLKKELELSKLQADIGKKVEEKIQGDQRRYFLLEQLKSIKKELGIERDDKTALIAKFEEKLAPFRASCPPQVLQVIEEETEKLQGLEPSSSEFNVTRNYLDWLTSVPWGHHSKENFDVRQAQQILDQDHYGLTDVKERILEFIAVGKLRGSSQGKIICLSGPPGTGKTSIGRSIAHALNRKFYRFSVGGLSDVAEIKGHRRTYVGAMPGKMVQCLKSVQTANPLVLIDEIDKLGRGYQGDPASALLELLDPEQNSNFLDHYLDVPVDLSKVLFMCTANVVEDIPGPLRDRMEVIRLVGYIADEKMHIARDYLEPTAQKNSGVRSTEAEIAEDALLELIETYCREAGVRNLQKQIDKVYRKIALRIVRQRLALESATQDARDAFNKSYAKRLWDTISANPKPQNTKSDEPENPKTTEAPSEHLASLEIEKGTEDKMVEDAVKDEEGAFSGEKVVVTKDNLSEFVGNPVFTSEKLYDATPVGVVMGLAWTAMGGSTLYVETSVIETGENKGGITVTGQLGDVMKESTSIALTVARGLLRRSHPDSNFFRDSRMHLHVPAGATPKDGPSAGCTMITSMLSLAMDKPVRPNLAMTGEVTLTGRVLPIGGVKEKTIAARRSGVSQVIFPFENKRDYDELPTHVKEGLDVHFVKHYSEIFTLAFEYDGEGQRPAQGKDSTVRQFEVES